MDGYGPQHPSEDLRFVGRYDDYRGGADRYWRDYRSALRRWFRYWDAWDEPSDRDKESIKVRVDRYAFYALKRRVFDVSFVVAEIVDVSPRNFARWLATDRGYPWRADCSEGDLQEIHRFLLDPPTIALARSEVKESSGPVDDLERDDPRDDPGLRPPAQVLELINRWALDEIDLTLLIDRLRPALHAVRGRGRSDLSRGDPPDVRDVLLDPRTRRVVGRRFGELMVGAEGILAPPGAG